MRRGCGGFGSGGKEGRGSGGLVLDLGLGCRRLVADGAQHS